MPSPTWARCAVLLLAATLLALQAVHAQDCPTQKADQLVPAAKQQITQEVQNAFTKCANTGGDSEACSSVAGTSAQVGAGGAGRGAAAIQGAVLALGCVPSCPPALRCHACCGPALCDCAVAPASCCRMHARGRRPAAGTCLPQALAEILAGAAVPIAFEAANNYRECWLLLGVRQPSAAQPLRAYMCQVVHPGTAPATLL